MTARRCVLLVAGGASFGDASEWTQARTVRQRPPTVVHLERAFVGKALRHVYGSWPFVRLVVVATCDPTDGRPTGAAKWCEIWGLRKGIQPVTYRPCGPAFGVGAHQRRTRTLLADWYPSHECRALVLPGGGEAAGYLVKVVRGEGIDLYDKRGWAPTPSEVGRAGEELRKKKGVASW